MRLCRIEFATLHASGISKPYFCGEWKFPSLLTLFLWCLLCNALIQPHFDYTVYCIQVWINASPKYSNLSHNKCIKFCLQLGAFKCRTDSGKKLDTNERFLLCACSNIFYKFFKATSPTYTAKIRHDFIDGPNVALDVNYGYRTEAIRAKGISYLGPKL